MDPNVKTVKIFPGSGGAMTGFCDDGDEHSGSVALDSGRQLKYSEVETCASLPVIQPASHTDF
jgi:hypothetical protein